MRGEPLLGAAPFPAERRTRPSHSTYSTQKGDDVLPQQMERSQQGVSPTERKRSQFQNMSQQESADWIRARWDVATRLKETLAQSVENGEIEANEVSPVLQHTIAVAVASLYGYTPKGSFIDIELLGQVGDSNSSLLSSLRSSSQNS